jgi:hypothetical protein
MVVIILIGLQQIGINIRNFPFYFCELSPWRIKRRKISSFASTLQYGPFHNKSQGDFKSFKLWGQRNKKSSKVEETRLRRTTILEKENKKVSTLMEGPHFSKLEFGADAKIDEGMGSNEKK